MDEHFICQIALPVFACVFIYLFIYGTSVISSSKLSFFFYFWKYQFLISIGVDEYKSPSLSLYFFWEFYFLSLLAIFNVFVLTKFSWLVTSVAPNWQEPIQRNTKLLGGILVNPSVFSLQSFLLYPKMMWAAPLITFICISGLFHCSACTHGPDGHWVFLIICLRLTWILIKSLLSSFPQNLCFLLLHICFQCKDSLSCSTGIFMLSLSKFS